MQRHHMDHFREAKLHLGDQLLFEGLDGWIACREKSSRRKEWHGYFLVGPQDHLEPGVHYLLTFQDGRTAEINASDIRGAESEGGQHAVEFYVVGEIRSPGRSRGLDREASRRSY